ncbi:MAG: hypothetical protein PHS49_06315 [Candidatus Gracilibacteria bacterium]|nr:hypothetical protein [Candidatus Gracilibacteria bacterium]
MNLLDNIHIPEFKNHKLTPNNPMCQAIDSTRLMVEILGGTQYSQSEYEQGTFSNKLLLDGQYALVIRYKREKDDTYYPAVTLSMDSDEDDNISINQLQGSKVKGIAYRFLSTFDSVSYYLKLIEESFTKKGIYVYVKVADNFYENEGVSKNAYKNYDLLAKGIERLNTKYGVVKKDEAQD